MFAEPTSTASGAECRNSSLCVSRQRALNGLTLFLISCRLAGGAGRIAASLTIIVLALFAIETVSLHAVDAMYYQPIAPILSIGWMWAIAAQEIL